MAPVSNAILGSLDDQWLSVTVPRVLQQLVKVEDRLDLVPVELCQFSRQIVQEVGADDREFGLRQL